MAIAEDLKAWAGQARQAICGMRIAPRLDHIGRVAQIGDGVAMVTGLPDTRLDELLVFESGARGLAVDLGDVEIGCVLLGDMAGIT